MHDRDLQFEMLILRIQQRGFKISHEYRNYLYEVLKDRPQVRYNLLKYYGV